MSENGDLPPGITYEDATAQFAQWLKYLPGDQWDMRLPQPK